MTLDEYMKQPGATEAVFAKKIGVSIPTVNRIRRGLQVPSPATARAIVKATEGLVSMNELYGVIAEDERPAKSARKKKRAR